MYFLLTTSSLAWTLMMVCTSVYIYIDIYNYVFGSLISDVTCDHLSADGGKGWPVVACPSRALVVLNRMLITFACYVFDFYVWDAVSIFNHLPRVIFVHGFCFSNNGLNMLPWTSFTCYTKDNQQGCCKLSNWFSLRRLGPWMNHLPPAW